jgi:hypothetical protein
MNIDFYGLFNFGDEDAVKYFVLAHQFTHDAEARAAKEQYGQTLTSYDVGGISIVNPWIMQMRREVQGIPPAMADWLESHNNFHQNLLLLLPQSSGMPATDLSLVNFSVPWQMYEWLTLHQYLHAYEQQQLGIT